METVQCETSNGMVKAQLRLPTPKQAKSNKVCPAEFEEKEMNGAYAKISHAPQSLKLKNSSGSVFLPTQSNKLKLQSLFHVKPIYSLGSFLTGLDIIGNQCSLVVKKTNSFPYSKYEITDTSKQDSSWKLSSNFIGSKYCLKKGGVSCLTMVFDVGCSSKCRTFTLYTLRDLGKWRQLQGATDNSDLEELYSKGSNYEHIAKYSNLEPTFNETTGISCLSFSRKYVVPCVQNTIVCNLNGERNLQMIKINGPDSLFQVSFLKNWEIEKVLAFVIASCDFKIGIE